MPYLNVPADSPSVSDLDSSAFEKLVRDLSAVLGPSSGLDSDDVDPMVIQKLMDKYVSNESEWHSFALGDASRAYTRNLIDEGNGKSNLLILVWTPGKGSAIHDHANAHCVMKILKGKLQETLYSWPDEERIRRGRRLRSSASLHGCGLYDERTGKSNHIKMSNFYSVRGKRPTDLEKQ
ncbi:hypothetical protein N7481_010864 [Penicillium waksmanii]|uniref:uncharacterized protein n=1 Tax=Penicillium waksmanii TaxID=69791 RepID=UPI0025497142|nr:uncharacterized protein N7481_010864 [Penicillium waksmanii]KAJ5973654.1 hypothetical protein N7481_010864 [Penicillium waksmanii]